MTYSELLNRQTKASLISYVQSLENKVDNLASVIELSEDGKLKLIARLWNIANDMVVVTGCEFFCDEFLEELHELGLYGEVPTNDEFRATLCKLGIPESEVWSPRLNLAVDGELQTCTNS